MRKRLCVLLAAVLAVSAFSGCTVQRNPASDDGKLHVVTTIFAPYDFARQVGGDDVSVTMLLRPGCEVHAYEPTPKDIIAIRNADVFIYVGGESDAWVKTVLEGVDNPNLRVVTLMDCVELLEEEHVEGMEVDEEEHDDGGVEYDEHVWTSPRNAKLICEKIAAALSEADPEGEAEYNAALESYCAELDELDAAFTDVVANGVRNTIVFGDRFPLLYFAKAYGLEYYAAWPGCADEAEPSSATVAFLIDKVNEEHIPVVFHIELSNEDMADTICEATGAEKLLFSACHNVTRAQFEEGVTYLDLMRQNVDALREALS